MTHTITKHDLYELCVVSPRHLVPMLRAVHAKSPTILAEDFAGTASLCDRWVQDIPGSTAIGVDLDRETLHYHPIEGEEPSPGVIKICCDVMNPNLLDEESCPPADVLHAGNFSIGYMHTREALLAYMQHAKQRLRPGGVFVCDTYGGESTFLIGNVLREHRIVGKPEDLPPGLRAHLAKRVVYTWEQREADPTTGRVLDVCHFRIETDIGTGGSGVAKIEAEFEDAFVYDWRLWSVPELRDALTEAGYSSVDVYAKLPDAQDDEGNVYLEPVRCGDDLDESFVVMVVGRTDA
ncbi:MAG: hypothetical protein AAF747_05970 [Planctomycetota bacterium]